MSEFIILDGFVPHPNLSFRDSNFLILGLKDANNRIGARNDPWVEKLRQIMETSVCLFVGLSSNSLSDRAIAPILSTTGDSFKDQRPLGIWICKENLVQIQKMNILEIILCLWKFMMITKYPSLF